MFRNNAIDRKAGVHKLCTENQVVKADFVTHNFKIKKDKKEKHFFSFCMCAYIAKAQRPPI